MDYTREAMLSMLESQKARHTAEITNLINESDFIYQCMENGFISPELYKQVPVTEGFYETIINFITNIILDFKKKTVKAMDDKYGDWLKEYRDAIEQSAPNTKLNPMNPFWEGQWSKDSKAISNAVSTAMSKYDDGKYDDYGFITPFMDRKSFDDPNVRVNTFKQYFRFNKKTAETVDSVTLSGQDLAKQIGGFLDYCINFSKNTESHITPLETMAKQTLKKSSVGKDVKDAPTADTKKDPQSVTDSFTMNTWLDIEQRHVSESSLNVLANYHTLLEAEGDKPEAPEQTTKVTVDKGDDTTDNAPGKPEDNKKSDGDKYLKDIENFMRDAVRAYLTAFNERYILYINTFLRIAQDNGFAPKYDKETKKYDAEATKTAYDNFKSKK